jgi:hypothetical protein
LPSILLESHFFTTMLNLASSSTSRHGHVPKVGLLCRVGSKPPSYGLASLTPQCGTATKRRPLRRQSECHACFETSLFFELVEVWVRGTKGVGLHHQQLVVRIISSSFLDTGCGLMLGPASSGGVDIAASGQRPRLRDWAGGGGWAGWVRLEPSRGQGSCQGAEGLRSKTKAFGACCIVRSAHRRGPPSLHVAIRTGHPRGGVHSMMVCAEKVRRMPSTQPSFCWRPIATLWSSSSRASTFCCHD